MSNAAEPPGTLVSRHYSAAIVGLARIANTAIGQLDLSAVLDDRRTRHAQYQTLGFSHVFTPLRYRVFLCHSKGNGKFGDRAPTPPPTSRQPRPPQPTH